MKPSKKLEIKKITLRDLDDKQLDKVAGGTGCECAGPTCACFTADTHCAVTTCMTC